MFEVGEVVVCVDARPPAGYNPVLAEGAFYRIAAFGLQDIAPLTGAADLGLHFVGVMSPTSGGFASHRFRKLPKADSEFTALIRECKPVKVEA